MKRSDAVKILHTLKNSQVIGSNLVAINIGIKAIEDIDKLSELRPCEYCLHYKSDVENDGAYSMCSKWICEFEVGKPKGVK